MAIAALCIGIILVGATGYAYFYFQPWLPNAWMLIVGLMLGIPGILISVSGLGLTISSVKRLPLNRTIIRTAIFLNTAVIIGLIAFIILCAINNTF